MQLSRWRLVAGVGVVAVLALTLIVLSVQGSSPSASSTTTTLSTEATTIATQSPPSTSASTEPTTLTTTAEQRLAEVEELLGDLWFGWFDAIYRKDSDALWQVVATSQFHNDGKAAMNTMTFIAAPTREDVLVGNVSILLDRPDCLVVQQYVDMSGFRGVIGEDTVRVLWPDVQRGFRFATAWQFSNDRWLDDCNDLARETTP
jgi:hypothetical protein